jgi:hypothetical protein
MNILKNINQVLLAISIILSVAIFSLYQTGKKLRKENSAYRHDVSVLMDSAKHYQVSDSLNAIQVKELQLKLLEYKKYRQEDAKLIEKLKAGKLQTVVNTKVKTKTEIKTQIRDSIIYKDTVKAISYTSKWTDINGFISKDTLQVSITNREELLLVESKQKKKFLFFKLPIWLFGYKEKTIDVTSKNPNTTIVGTEYVNFR